MVVPLKKILIVGKAKESGKRGGEKPMRIRGDLNVTLFVFDVESGVVHTMKGQTERSLSVGQVVWASSGEVPQQGLVFVGWSSETRKLGIKYCYNWPCALYFIQCQFGKSEAKESAMRSCVSTEDTNIVILTERISSTCFPRFRSAIEILEAEIKENASQGNLSLSETESSEQQNIQASAEIATMVQIHHMALALSKAYRSPVVETIQSLPQHQQIILCSVAR